MALDHAEARSAEAPAAPAAAPLPPHRLSVVVPMYDERENAAPLVDAVQAALAGYPHPWELVVVDDGSRDGTGVGLERRAAEVGPHIRVVRLRRNFGQSAAMQAGIHHQPVPGPQAPGQSLARQHPGVVDLVAASAL